MTKQPVDLLQTPGFFLCEKSQCILRIEVCLKRQKMSGGRAKNKAASFYICEDCDQGEKNLLAATPSAVALSAGSNRTAACSSK